VLANYIPDQTCSLNNIANVIISKMCYNFLSPFDKLAVCFTSLHVGRVSMVAIVNQTMP